MSKKNYIQSTLMIGITDQVAAWGVTQREAVFRLGVSQPRLNGFLKGKFSKFWLDGLIKIALPVGLGVQMKIKGRR